MLTFLNVDDIPWFDHGEFVVLRAKSDTLGEEYSYSVFSTEQQKYLDSENAFILDNPYDFDTEVVDLPSTTEELHVIKVNTTTLSTNDLLVISTENKADASENYENFVEVGTSVIADTNITIEVYGFLRDAYGQAINNIPISFTVMNTTTYFDNSPSTSMNASTKTDYNGKFSINLNRNYDYTLSISRLNYLKVIKLSELPNDASVVEVDLGTGLGC